jgi:alpha-glucosidase
VQVSTYEIAGNSGDAPSSDEWWRPAVVDQVYIRSFADAYRDVNGDLADLHGRLPHLRELGVDAMWVNPWDLSPQAAAGFDVSGRDIERDYGTLAEADALIAAAHAAGLLVILDVPTHTSPEHAWFLAAMAGDADARARYIFGAGRGADGEWPPNDWVSDFGGPAWSRSTGPDGEPGEWYLHLFAPEQPDLRWDNPFVRAEFEDVLRFWFDRGVDGFRINMGRGLPQAPDNQNLHESYRAWREIADSYDPPRIFVEQSWASSSELLALVSAP